MHLDPLIAQKRLITAPEAGLQACLTTVMGMVYEGVLVDI